MGSQQAERHCVDCRWLELQVDLDGGDGYFCRKHERPRGTDVLWKNPCADFAPLETTAAIPEAPPAPRRLPSRKPELFRPPDPDGFRRFLRDEKDLSPRTKRMTEAEAVRRFVRPGDYLGFELYGTVRCPMSVVREIVRQRIGGLKLLGQGLMDVDFLVAAGLVSAMDLTYVGYEAYGLSPILRRAVESGSLALAEWSNAAISWRLKAAAMGLPFLPARSMLGSDTLARSPAKTMRDPYTGMLLALLPALTLDCAVVHVHRADAFGNCQIDGISGFALEISQAARRLIVSAEEIVDTEMIRARPDRTAIPHFLVDAVVHAPFGSHPGEMCGRYCRDERHLRAYLDVARSDEGMRAYFDAFVHGARDQAGYLERIGTKRLDSLLEPPGG